MFLFTEPFGNPDVGLVGHFAFLVQKHDRSPFRGAMLCSCRPLQRLLFQGLRGRLVINDRLFVTRDLVSLDVLVQGLDSSPDKRLRLFFAVLPLGQLNEQATGGEKWEGKSLFQRAKPVPPFFQRATKFYAMRFPLTTHGLDVINLDGEVLYALPVLLDKFIYL